MSEFEFVNKALGLEPVSLAQVGQIIDETDLKPKVPIDRDQLRTDLEVNRAFVWLLHTDKSRGKKKEFAMKVEKQAKSLIELLVSKDNYGICEAIFSTAFNMELIQKIENKHLYLFMLARLSEAARSAALVLKPKQGKSATISAEQSLYWLLPIFEKHWGHRATAQRKTDIDNPKPEGPTVRFLVSTARIIQFLPKLPEVSEETASKAIYFQNPDQHLLDEIFGSIKNSPHVTGES